MSTRTELNVDYLVVGAGAMGMAFVDTILTSKPKATIALVDKYARPGGHWTTAYPFVRLHQPSAYYGVASKHLGQDKIDQIGLNKGHYELATSDEVTAYFTQVLHETFLPSGRVQYFPKSVWNGDREFDSILTGQKFSVGAQTKLVDSTYMNVTVPSMRPPPFPVESGVELVTPNDMVKVTRTYSKYTVVGAGKTGIDACLWLLTMGIDPDRITWIMPRDSWLYNRTMFNRFGKDDEDFAKQYARNILEATSAEDLYSRMVAAGEALRLDENVKPTMFRCATVSTLEVEALRRIKNIVRLGRVHSIKAGEIILEHGSVAFSAKDTIFIDCTADGLEQRPAVPMFTPGKITLQPVRFCQQVFSAAFIAHVEATYEGDEAKNSLCGPVPHPNRPVDLLKVMDLQYQNIVRWSWEPATVAWLRTCRLNWLTTLNSLAVEDEAEREVAGGKVRGNLTALSEKVRVLLAASKVDDDVQARL